jgi:hypothetical protein
VKQNLKPGEFVKSVPIEKVDEVKQEAWGVFTAEVPDSDDEIADYEYQKGKVQSWSDGERKKAEAAGMEPSLGNVRFSHTVLPTGKVIALTMDDSAKQIKGGTYLMNVGDTKTWDMVAKGILKGFSFGGSYDWRKCAVCGRDMPLVQGDNFCDTCGGNQTVRYGATIAELSVCDRPAVPVANILHIKADGSRVHLIAEANVEKDEKKTKRVAGEDLTADCFAYVGDESKTETWKFPLHFSSKEKSARHVRNALARFDQSKGIPADEKPKVKAKIIAAAKKYGVEVSEDEEKGEKAGLAKSFVKAEVQRIKASFAEKAQAAGITLRKDMYDVGNMAELLQRIAWLRYSAIQEREYEGDDSEVPEELEENLISLSETFLAMAREETAELVAAAKKAGKVTTMEKNETINPEVANTLIGHVVDTAAHHESMADAHKAQQEEHEGMAAHHTEQAKVHKAVSEHFKKAAEDGGEHEEHHAMLADAHKAHMEDHLKEAAHHTTKAAHHESMHKMHKEMAEKCSKLADTFATTPEQKSAVAAQFKAARDAKPTVVKSAAVIPISTEGMSTNEKAAFDAVNSAWLNSEEYKKMATDALRKQTIAKLNATANGAAIVVGVQDAADATIYAVQRPGQSNKSADFAEGGTSIDDVFELPVLN